MLGLAALLPPAGEASSSLGRLALGALEKIGLRAGEAHASAATTLGTALVASIVAVAGVTATEAALGEPTTFFGGTPAPAWIESGPLRAAGSHSFVSVEGDGTGHVVRRERRAEESYATRYSRLGPEAGGCSVRHVLTPEVGHPVFADVFQDDAGRLTSPGGTRTAPWSTASARMGAGPDPPSRGRAGGTVLRRLPGRGAGRRGVRRLDDRAR